MRISQKWKSVENESAKMKICKKLKLAKNENQQKIKITKKLKSAKNENYKKWKLSKNENYQKTNNNKKTKFIKKWKLFWKNPVLVLRQVQLWTTNCELCKSAAPIDNEIHIYSSSSCFHAITSTEE